MQLTEPFDQLTTVKTTLPNSYAALIPKNLDSIETSEGPRLEISSISFNMHDVIHLFIFNHGQTVYDFWDSVCGGGCVCSDESGPA